MTRKQTHENLVWPLTSSPFLEFQHPYPVVRKITTSFVMLLHIRRMLKEALETTNPPGWAEMWAPHSLARAYLSSVMICNSLAQSESTFRPLVFPCWSIFSHGPKRLTLYFLILWATELMDPKWWTSLRWGVAVGDRAKSASCPETFFGVNRVPESWIHVPTDKGPTVNRQTIQ